MMIGVDLRALQIGHQFRGIGEVVKRTLNEIFVIASKEGNSFAFYTYDDLNDPKQLLEIPKQLQYKSISMGNSPQSSGRSKLEKLVDSYSQLYGNPIKNAKECNVFLQYDYALGVPNNTKTILIKHDIIPFIFWDQFFESPMVPFKNKALRTTLRTAFHNYRSKKVLKNALKKADKIVTVSDYTKQDLNKHFNVPLSKMVTVHLGVNEVTTKTTGVAKKQQLPTKPFLLFIGAVDKRRRRVDDLVAAYNNLSANGFDIQLVLAGENFQSPEGIPQGPVRTAVMSSSYADGILTLGYIDDATKQYLYKNAIAFVFPTMYEGFGIPVLEAMLYKCPVIAYENSAVKEVGQNHVLYADGWVGIYDNIKQVMSWPENTRKSNIEQANRYALGFSWHTSAQKLYSIIKESL
jgi:glycosyltransferase involved in cell wall biosynthesis